MFPSTAAIEAKHKNINKNLKKFQYSVLKNQNILLTKNLDYL